MQNALILKTAVFAGEGKQPEMFKGFEILTLCGILAECYTFLENHEILTSFIIILCVKNCLENNLILTGIRDFFQERK